MPIRNFILTLIIFLLSSAVHAADSYRFFHVTIDTPWLIFIFLLMIILFPFVLSAILYWHFTLKKRKEKKQQAVGENVDTVEGNASINSPPASEKK